MQVHERYNNEAIPKNEHYQADPTGLRTGCGPGPQLVEVFERVACDAESILSEVTLYAKENHAHRHLRLMSLVKLRLTALCFRIGSITFVAP